MWTVGEKYPRSVKKAVELGLSHVFADLNRKEMSRMSLICEKMFVDGDRNHILQIREKMLPSSGFLNYVK